VIKLFDLPPTCFVPAPKIWSSVLLFKPREESYSKDILDKVEMLTGLSFGQRRKMIRQSLKSVKGIFEIFEELGINPELRAENLTPEQYVDIAKRLI
jgi:16S rRNA (adenine1518-N6/adenine1519-N6)-dimethyltransferase